MIDKEQEYRQWIIKFRNVDQNTVDAYVKYLTSVVNTIGDDISPQNLSSEIDILRITKLLEQHGTPKHALDNWKTAMKHYVEMIKGESGGSTIKIDLRIKKSLLEIYEKLDADGELPSDQLLQDSYCSFREMFAPEKLKISEGKELLQLIHGRGNNDSLVYHLEFRLFEFGGIRGGDATKFGIYYKQQTNEWITGTGRAPQVISEEAAILYVTKQRDQLLAGIAALSELPQCASDAEYISLQQKLELVAPDVCCSGWVHKYWHMLFPEKLDDYHNESYQRYYLIKMLQNPPEVKGLYVCAGSFVRIASELGWHICHLTTVLNKLHGKPVRYWRIGTQIGGVDSIWNNMREGGYAAIGWPNLGDIGFLNEDNTDGDDTLRHLLQQHYEPVPPQILTNKVRQITKFVKTMAEEDIVIAAQGQSILGVGRVTGPYIYEPTVPLEAPNRRSVKWLSTEKWNLPNVQEGLQTTVYEIKKIEKILGIENHIVHGANIPPNITNSQIPLIQLTEVYTAQNMINEGVFLEMSEIANIKKRLESKKNLILQGAPGVGKTFVAKKLAYLLMGEKADDRIVSVQFHPSYSYEDFVRGYRPTNEAGKFELIDGSFWSFCDKARRNPDRNYVMLVDEINRGNLSQIFGELFMLLESDKRGEEVSPLYKKTTEEKFSIPPNVYLIGTMNIADRSLALVDYALRRRFAFVTLAPKYDSAVYKSWLRSESNNCPDELCKRIVNRMSELNKMICDDRLLGSAFRIGHSFFCHKPNVGYNDEWFNEIIETEIIPLLEEYWHGEQSKLDEAKAVLR